MVYYYGEGSLANLRLWMGSTNYAYILVQVYKSCFVIAISLIGRPAGRLRTLLRSERVPRSVGR